MNDPFTVADTAFASRLFVGTARYPNQQVMLDCAGGERRGDRSPSRSGGSASKVMPRAW